MFDQEMPMPDIPDEFWKLIDLARTDYEAFVAALRTMEREDLVRFYWTYEDAAAELKEEPYIDNMSPDISEDGIDDVAQWVVAQGKKFYLDVIQEPNKVPLRVDSAPEILGEVVIVFDDRYDEPIPYPDEDY